MQNLSEETWIQIWKKICIGKLNIICMVKRAGWWVCNAWNVFWTGVPFPPPVHWNHKDSRGKFICRDVHSTCLCWCNMKLLIIILFCDSTAFFPKLCLSCTLCVCGFFLLSGRQLFILCSWQPCCISAPWLWQLLIASLNVPNPIVRLKHLGGLWTLLPTSWRISIRWCLTFWHGETMWWLVPPLSSP